MLSSLILAVLLGQFGNGQCPAPAIYAPAAQSGGYELKRIPVVYGGLSVVVEGWQPIPGGEVSFRLTDPFNVAAIAAARLTVTPKTVERKPVEQKKVMIGAGGDPFPGGVVPSKTTRGPNYHADSPAARTFVAELTRPSADAGDDKMHVTVIGNVDDSARVVNDIETDPAFALIRGKLLVQEYREGEWPIDPELGFQQGRPAILVQSARNATDTKGGRVLYRAVDYSMGPEALAEEIRKADPNYRPDDDPGPVNGGRKPKVDPLTKKPCPLGFNRTHKPYVIAAVVGIALLYTFSRKEQVKP